MFRRQHAWISEESLVHKSRSEKATSEEEISKEGKWHRVYLWRLTKSIVGLYQRSIFVMSLDQKNPNFFSATFLLFGDRVFREAVL